MCKIATSLLELLSTSAATERSFSTYGWIYNAKRNRLTVQRASQLTYIAHNLTLLNPTNKKKKQNKKRILGANGSESSDSENFEEETEEIVLSLIDTEPNFDTVDRNSSLFDINSRYTSLFSMDSSVEL